MFLEQTLSENDINKLLDVTSKAIREFSQKSNDTQIYMNSIERNYRFNSEEISILNKSYNIYCKTVKDLTRIKSDLKKLIQA